jgi:hypothetical protein
VGAVTVDRLPSGFGASAAEQIGQDRGLIVQHPPPTRRISQTERRETTPELAIEVSLGVV